MNMRKDKANPPEGWIYLLAVDKVEGGSCEVLRFNVLNSDKKCIIWINNVANTTSFSPYGGL
jgi:hypothetical protein